jgi:hypothetical protein
VRGRGRVKPLEAWPSSFTAVMNPSEVMRVVKILSWPKRGSDRADELQTGRSNWQS